MNHPDAQRNPLEELADAFLERYRRGERPSLTEYVRQFPELAEEIRDLFPTLVMMEEAVPGDTTAARGGPVASTGPALERLGDYRIVREVGRGGMGIVYEAEQEALGRRVALKVLPLAIATNPTSLLRFRREARSAARLHHTNIVPVFDVGTHHGVHYYAMQFIQGQGLDQVLVEVKRLRAATGTPAAPAAPLQDGGKQTPNLNVSLADGLMTGRFRVGEPAEDDQDPPPTEPARAVSEPPPAADIPGASRLADAGTATSDVLRSQSEFSAESHVHYYHSVARLGLQVAQALAYAQGHKVLHRDIKPSNLLLDMQGTVWVTDFGLAKEEGSDLTRTGDIVGTLRYMAPERFKGISDPRSDIYSLGLTLYELLALRPAFEDAHRNPLLWRIVHEEPPPLRRWDPQIPRDLETIVLKAAAKDPQRRYQTAEALADDLRRFLADQPIRARRTSMVEHAWRWCRRNPALAVAALLACAGIFATVALSIWFAAYQGEANEELRRRQKTTEEALFQSRFGQARLAEERGLQLLRQGDTSPGLIWLARALELAPDGAVDLQANLRRQLAMWNERATPLRQVLAHPAQVTALAFSPDGQTIFTGCADGKARCWDARTGTLLDEPAALGAAVDGLVPSFDGQTLCVLNKHERRFLDATSGQPLVGQRGDFPPWELLTDPWVRCSANGKTVIRIQPCMGGVNHIGIGSLTTEITPGKQSTIPIEPIFGPFNPMIALSPDGQLFLTASSSLQVRSAKTGAPVGKPLTDANNVSKAFFRSDGKALLTATSQHAVRAWDLLTGQPLSQPLPHPDSVTALAYSPDGRQVLTACSDGVVRLWDLTVPTPSFRDVRFPELNGEDRELIFNESQSIVVDGKEVYRHDGAQAKHMCSLPLNGQLDRVAVGPGGQILATASRDERNSWGRPAKVRFWNADTGRQVGPTLTHPDTVSRLAFSPDGATLATCCHDGKVRFWKVGTDIPAGPALSHHPRVFSYIPIAFSPDGTLVLTGCDGKAHLWDRAVGTLLHTFAHLGAIDTVAISPGGTRLVVGGDGTARLWDIATRQPIGPSMTYSTGNECQAIFSPDGHVILMSSFGHVQLWEASTGLPLGPQLPWDEAVRARAFDPDGQSVLVGHASRHRHIPIKQPVIADVARIVLSTQVLTGLELDAGGAVNVLDAATWNERRRRLDEMGGPLLP